MSTPATDSNGPPPAPLNVKRPLAGRRFRLIDVMILIAATAAGFGLLRWGYELSLASLPRLLPEYSMSPLLSEDQPLGELSPPRPLPEYPETSPLLSKDQLSKDQTWEAFALSLEPTLDPAPPPPALSKDEPLIKDESLIKIRLLSESASKSDTSSSPSASPDASEVGTNPQDPRSNVTHSSVSQWLFLGCSYGIAVLEPFMVAWTLAFIPIRLLKPRPRQARLGTQPGFVAMAAAAFGIIVAGLIVGLPFNFSAVMRPIGDVEWGIAGDMLDHLLRTGPLIIGTAVAASWLILIVGRRWRAEPHWIDRLGRIIGLYWIAALPIVMLKFC